MSGLFHVNEYSLNRAYGGPEEGGWWYDTGRSIRCHGTWPTREAAVKARKAMTPTIAAARHGLYSPGSPLCTGWPDVRIEPHAGADFPGDSQRWHERR